MLMSFYALPLRFDIWQFPYVQSDVNEDMVFQVRCKTLTSILMNTFVMNWNTDWGTPQTFTPNIRTCTHESFRNWMITNFHKHAPKSSGKPSLKSSQKIVIITIKDFLKTGIKYRCHGQMSIFFWLCTRCSLL